MKDLFVRSRIEKKNSVKYKTEIIFVDRRRSNVQMSK